MGVLICVVGIGIVWFCVPYIRCLFKRLNLLFKIQKLCREKGHRLFGTYSFWFLGGKNGKNYDCIIETAEEVPAIKLFGMPRRKRVLVFTEKREYFTRILVGMLLLIRETFDGKARQLPEYDFTCVNKEVSGEKKLRKILLVNPVPMEMLWQAENGKERILSPGDAVYGMELANLSWFLKELR